MSVSIINCRAQYFYGEGYQSFGQTTGFQMLGCIGSNNGKDGFNMSSQGGVYVDCIARGNAYNGFEMQCINSSFSGIIASGNTQSGLSFVGGTANQISSTQCFGNGSGFEFNGETSSVATGVFAQANIQIGIEVVSSTNCDIINAKVYSNGQTSQSGNKVGIYSGSNTGCRYIGFDIRNTPAVTGFAHLYGLHDTSTGTEIRGGNSNGGTSLDYWLAGTNMSFFEVKNPASVIQWGSSPGSGLSINQADVTLSGSPLNVVPCGVGSIAHNTTGGSGTTLYVKETASSGSDSTGWVAKGQVNSVTAGDSTIAIGGTSSVPTIEAKGISGVVVSGTPSSGQVLTATSSTAADWASPGTGIPYSTVTTAGDLIAGTGNATIERLGIGAAGAVLTVGGADPSGLEWSAPIGAQVAYAVNTAGNISCPPAVSTWTAFSNSPSITLPNDGRTYKVEATCPATTPTVAGTVYVALGTSTSALLQQIQSNLPANTHNMPVNLVAQKVVGSGQTISLYCQTGATSNTISLWSTAAGPCELAAYGVA